MNAPFASSALQVALADLSDPNEVDRIDALVREQGGSVFHTPAWLKAVEAGTKQTAIGLIAEKGGALVGWLPLNEIHSSVFGRMLASSGFAVEGGILSSDPKATAFLANVAEELAQRRCCPTIELRGGVSPAGWVSKTDSHCGFVSDLAEDDEEQLLAIPRKQRAEVRKGLKNDLQVSVGSGAEERNAHYAVYSESVRNLGTPVFPRSLFDAVLDSLDADILTVRHQGEPVASVLSLYYDGAVMPYWGGGVFAARHLRANDVMYYKLMLHARGRGCERFDFGRSKTRSGAYNFKKNWGFEPEPLSYSVWTAPGHEKRDADPTSAKHARQIAIWQKLPLSIANRIGPIIARGLG